MQQLNITPGVVVAILVVVLLVLGSYWFMRSGDRRGPLRGIPRSQGAQQASTRSTQGAKQLETSLTRLLHAKAGWNEIVQTVNPTGVAKVAADLQAIRGPHMFAPALAIQVLQEGCKLALSRNPGASIADAVQLARESMERVTRYGD